jgi:protein TonB
MSHGAAAAVWSGVVAAGLVACAPAAPPPAEPAAAVPAPAPAAVPAGYTLVTDPAQAPDDPDAVWLVRAVTERPRMTRPVPLVYPDSLRRRGVGGDVVVEFVVDTLGRVEPEVRVIEAAHPGLAEPARQTIRPARFAPGHVNGRKVRVLMTLRFHFTPRRS